MTSLTKIQLPPTSSASQPMASPALGPLVALAVQHTLDYNDACNEKVTLDVFNQFRPVFVSSSHLIRPAKHFTARYGEASLILDGCWTYQQDYSTRIPSTFHKALFLKQ